MTKKDESLQDGIDNMLAELDSKEIVTNNNRPTGGIVGLEAEDLKMPYMYLVRANNQFAVLPDGSKAKEGTFFHSTRRASYETMDVVIALAKKERSEKQKDGQVVRGKDGLPELESVWRTLMFDVNSPHAPFSFSFKGMNYWIGFKDFLTELQTKNKLMNEIVVTLTSVDGELKTEAGVRKYPVVKLAIKGDATEEQKEIARELETRFLTSSITESYDE